MKASLPYFIVILSFFTPNNLKGQSIILDVDAIGFILCNDTIKGTGFIMFDSVTVITCAHVVDNETNISYSPVGSEEIFDLKIYSIDIDNDIAILKSENGICRTPFQPDYINDVEPTQHLFYIGYDKNISDSNLWLFRSDHAIDFGQTVPLKKIIQ